MKIINIKCLGQWGVSTSGNTNTFYIQTESFGILIDCGGHTVFELKKRQIPIEKISHIFLSHCHADHLAGFCNFVFMRTVEARVSGYSLPELKVISNKETIDSAKKMIAANYPDREFVIKYMEISSSDEIRLDNLSWKFTDCVHSVPTNGLILRASNASFGYTADTLPDKNVFMQYSDLDLLAVECFGTDEHFGKIAEMQKHLTSQQAEELVALTQPKSVMLFHLHSKYSNDTEMKEITKNLLSLGEQEQILLQKQEKLFS